MYILTRVNLLYTVCYEIPCTSRIKFFLLAKVALRILQQFRFRSEEQPALPIDPFQKYEEKKRDNVYYSGHSLQNLIRS